MGDRPLIVVLGLTWLARVKSSPTRSWEVAGSGLKTAISEINVARPATGGHFTVRDNLRLWEAPLGGNKLGIERSPALAGFLGTAARCSAIVNYNNGS